MSLSHVWPQAHAEDQGRRRIGDYDETPPRINGIDDLKAHAGEDLGVTSWHDVTQTVGAVDDVPAGVMVTSAVSFEREGGEKPVCVAETLMLAYAS
jgi:hypothetical protein